MQILARNRPTGRIRARLGRPGKALTASAARAQDSPGALLRLDQPWQQEAMKIYRTQGECAAPAQYQGRAMERIRYYPAVLDEKGIPQESDDPALLELFHRIRSPGGAPGDLSEIAGTYAKLQFVIGDGLLTVSRQQGEEAWEYLSPMELRVKRDDSPTRPQQYQRIKAIGVPPEELTEAPDDDFEPAGIDQARVWRLWRRHPEYCVDEKTELFTREGWKSHEDLRPGMLALTLNHETGETEWQPIQAVNRFAPDDREMVSLEGRMHSSLTTLDHRWPTLHYGRAPLRLDRLWTTSERLNSNDRIITAADHAELPGERTFDDAFVEAVAWFWTEGSISKRYRSAQVSLSQSEKVNPVFTGRIRDSLASMFGIATEERMSTGGAALAEPMWREHRRSDHCIEFWLNTAASERLLEVAPAKIVSLDFVRALTRDQLEIFVETSIDADGWRIGDTACRIYQTDAARLVPLEYAAILLGRTTRMRGNVLTITKRVTVDVQCEAKRKSGRLNQPTMVRHSGMIWCPTTANGTWLARRKGCVFYTGNSQWADSPVRPVIELYHLLERLTLAVGAEASSRAAQRGALIVPEEWSFGPADPTQEENPEEDPLLRELQDSMARAIREPGSAEAMAPFVMRVQGVTQTSGGAIPSAELMKWIPLGPQDRYSELEAWNATIGRLAADVDMPKELFTGVGDVSHWGQWFLDDIGFRQHTGPTVVRFCNDIGSAYLRPAAVAARIKNAERVTMWFDAADAVNHPDQTGTALKAHAQLAVSDQYLRSTIGATESAKPSEKELARRVAIALKEFPSDLEPEPQTGATPPSQGGRGGDVTQEAPTSSPTRPSGARPPSPQGPSLAAMIAGAAVMQIDRARELAGNRLVRRAQSCEECREAIKGIKPGLVAAALGADQVRSVIAGHADEPSLVAGIGTAFADRLVAWGVDGGWPVQLGQMVEQHALRTLYEREVPPLPPGFMAACERATGGLNGNETLR